MGKKKVSHEDCFGLATSDWQESGTHEADGGKDGGGVWERTIKMKTEKSWVKMLAGGWVMLI